MPGSRVSRRKAPSRDYHHGDLRRALVESSLDLIEKEGVERVTLRGVARAAGVSHMAPYNHFADKSALVAAAAAEGFRKLQAAMEAAVAKAAGAPPERLAAAGVAYAVFAVRHPALFRLMFGPELADKRSHPELAAAADAVFQTLLGQIAATGIGPGDPGAARAFALTPWSLVHGLAMLAAAGQIPDATPATIEALARQATGYLAVGLANLSRLGASPLSGSG